MKTVFIMSLIAILLVPTTLPLVFAPSTPDHDDVPGPGDTNRLIKKITEFANHMAEIDAHLLKLSIIIPGPPKDQTVLVSHLGVITHHLDKIEVHLNQVQANMPPGPPNNPILIANLQSIITSANHITGIVSQWQQNQNDPGVIAALQSIIDNANAISSTATILLSGTNGGCPPHTIDIGGICVPTQ